MNFFINNTRLVVLITLVFVFLGVRGLKSLQKESTPPVDFATAVIMTGYPGSSSSEVEELITKKIENEIRTVSHLKDVHSVSKPGYSEITIRIDIDNVDSQQIVNELSQSLQNVKGLPPEVLDPPRLVYINATKQKPVINLYLSGPDENRKKDVYAWQLKNAIEKIEGVLQVNLTNYKKREFTVLLSNKKMKAHSISSGEVIFALQKHNMDIPAGYLESSKSKYLTRLIGKFRSIQELENIVIRSNFSGNKIQVKDIAQVKDSFEKQSSKAYIYSSRTEKDFNLQPSVYLSVFKSLTADIIEVVKKVQTKSKKLNEEFSKSTQNPFQLISAYDASRETKRRLSSVVNNALFGMFLIFIIFLIFLPSRVGLMASLSLPLSVLGVFSFLPFMGVSFNVITMLAFVICIGMLVDNSVVISEYYARLTMENQIEPHKAATQVVRQFFIPITATVLTTIVAFLPMLITKGVMGEFIKWIPIVVTCALLMSLFESFFLLPNRLQWLVQKKPNPYQRSVLNTLNKIEDSFSKLLTVCVNKKYFTISGIGFLIFVTVLVFKFGVNVRLFSNKNPEFYTATLKAKPNLPLMQMDIKTKQIADKMQLIFGGKKTIDWMSVHTGENSSSILLKLKPSVLRQIKYKDILEKLRKIEKGDILKNLYFGVLAGGPPVGKALNIALLSNDRKNLREFIDKVQPEISKIEGLTDIRSNPDTNKGMEYKLTIKDQTLAKLGLDFKSVGLAIRTALEGTIIKELTENNESFYIRVKHDEAQMSSIEDIKNITITEFIGGRRVPLGQFVNISKVLSEPDKKTYNFSPVVFLEANIDSKKTSSLIVNSKAQQIIEKEIKNYPFISYKLIGEQETTQESLRSLFQAAGIAFFAILMILIVLFRSFTFSFLILSCIPLGLIGVVWSFFLHNRDLNFFAMIGVVGLAGVVVNSAIILISFILKLQKEEPQTDIKDIVVKASKIRFRPILITNLTTLGGLLPTAYGIPSFEALLMPMTLALFWGLFTATLLTLFWIPCTYLVIEDIKMWFLNCKITRTQNQNSISNKIT